MQINWQPFHELINRHNRFILTSHVRPDADALGSELGLAAVLRHLGKTVQIVNHSATPKRLVFLDPEQTVLQIGSTITLPQCLEAEVLVVVDTSAWVQLGDMGDVVRRINGPKVVIDHHVSSDDLGAIVLKDVTSEATGALIVQLARSLNLPLTAEMAAPLYCAIATDTGWFRFSSTTSGTMHCIGDLIDAGAVPHALYSQLYEQHTVGRMRLAGRAMGRIRLECDGRMAHTFIRWDDYAETQSDPSDTEELINDCLRIAGVQCAFIAIEQSNRQIKISFRSRTTLNVATVAEQFRGGGHKQAAGAILSGPLADAQNKALTALRTALTA